MRTTYTKTKNSRLLTVLTAAILIFIGNFNVGFGQTALPVSRTTWNGTVPPGWTDIAVGSYTSTFACSGSNGAKFDGNSQSYIVNFSGVPDKLTFVTKSNSTTTSTLLVQESSDGISYTTVVSLSGATDLPTTCTTKGPYNILASSKFVKWTFTKGSSNLTMDDVSITEAIVTCTAPTIQATTAAFSTITNNSMNLSWTSGNGNGRIVVMKEASAVSGTPTSGTAYTGNATFGSGSTIATGEFVVYNGTGNSVSVNGLKCGTTYHVKVYEYNTIGNCYNTIVPASASATTSSPTVTIMPNLGPVGTMVTLMGTNLTGATAVKFGSVNATSFTVVNSTTILAEVPAGIGTNEIISITDASLCNVTSVGTYNLTSISGSCSSYPGYTDLFMSEVYDKKPGNGWYMELYNPTNSPITLTGVYQIERYGDLNLTGSYNLIDLTGTVAPMSTFVIQLHSDVTCPSLSVDFQTPISWGINANDRIRLIKNGIVVDDVSTPAYIGYTILRDLNPAGTAPNTAYPTVGWTTLLNEDCSDLGTFILPPSSSIVINTQPADITGCSLTMTVTSPTPGVTYQWKFNNPASMTGWLDVNSTNIPSATISGATSATLTITGDVSALMDFQFYCELSESGCSILSNAAQFKIDARPIYRSVAASNGNWSTVSNWEMSTDYTTYVAACSYPRSINSSEVIIQSGTRIVLDLTGANVVDIDHLTIQNTGTLELLPNAKLTIYDSVVGTDLLVHGTLYDRGNASNGLDLVGSTSWELGSNGTIIKSNEAPVVIYRQKYQGGMSNIPATANWIYRYTGDGHPVVGTEDFFYPNLSFENTTASTYSWNNPVNTAFQGSTGFATVKGNFKIGVTGTSTCQVSNLNSNLQPMLLLGNLEIATGSGLNTNVGTSYGTGFDLKGNLTVNGSLRILDAIVEERVLRFTGTTNQTVSGTGTIDLYKMTVNKTSGDVVLNRNLQTQNELVMTSGNILTNANLLELGLSTTQKGTLNHTSGFVVGKMRRWFDGTNAGNASGLYPMGFTDLLIGSGLKNRHAKIEFNNAPAAGGHLTIEYIGAPMGLAGIPIAAVNSGGAGFDVTTTEDQGYWKIDNEAGKLIGANYTIACTGEGYQTITNLAQLTLLKRVGAGNWFCPGAHLATTGTIAMPTCTRSGVSNWSNFGFGGSVANPLPVKLTAFNVSCDENQINIQWTTASEQNSSHFVVEKSRDLINWTAVSRVEAAGQSNQEIQYNSADLNGSNGVFYYRLKQVDFNGESEFYGPISVSCESDINAMIVYPNPSNGDFTLEIKWNQPSTFTQIQIIDLTGKIIQEMDLNLNVGTTQVAFNQENLQMGTYLIRIQESNLGLKPVRLVIKK